MGKPEMFDVVWEGCGHTEEERDFVFEKDKRYCKKCGLFLKEKYFCKKDNTEPISIVVKINYPLKAVLTVCPECGEFFSYEVIKR